MIGCTPKNMKSLAPAKDYQFVRAVGAKANLPPLLLRIRVGQIRQNRRLNNIVEQHENMQQLKLIFER
jgi:hypothetical protein